MLIPSNFESIDYSNVKRVSEIIADMALTAQNQKELTDGITELRAGALKSGNLERFDTLIKHLQDPKVNNNITEFQIRYDYTFEDYSETEQPYWDVFNQPTQMARNQRLEVLTVSAKDVGYKSFKKTYQLFCKNLRKLNVQIEGNASKNPTQFSEQPLELNAGDWRCDDTGIVRETGSGLVELACRHPIMPVQRLVNIDTGEEKLKIAYCKGKYWREIIVGKKELFDASKIIQLASVGVSVTSKTARILSEYMCDIEAINYEYIEEVESVARLGYIGDGKMFSPYVDSIVFDGDANYKNIFNAITSKGSYEKWLETALMCRKDNVTAQIMIASSFASVLIGKLGCLPFFVHLWGVDSGTGKTVALMLSASVWGDPDVGKYIQTFNATQVGHEKTASFLNNIPMCIDELQLSKDKIGRAHV